MRSEVWYWIVIALMIVVIARIKMQRLEYIQEHTSAKQFSNYLYLKELAAIAGVGYLVYISTRWRK